MAVDPDLAVRFDCARDDYFYVPKIDLEVEGYALDKSFSARINIPLTVSARTIVGEVVYAGDPYIDTIPLEVTGDAAANLNKRNWVAWSQIGNVSFELDRTNTAGQRPMKWPGYVYEILQLGSGAVVYGSHGVTLMYPVDSPAPTFGFQDLRMVGIKNKDAVAGTEKVHYCLDKLGELYQVTKEGLKLLGYKEFLGALTNPVLKYNEYLERLYISDSSKGYIFNENALGGGYGNFTDMAYIDGHEFMLTPGTISSSRAEAVTDVFDFGTRNHKDIEAVELGIDTANLIEVALDYRYSRKNDFSTSSWIRVNDSGIARLKISALEFRLRIRNVEEEAATLTTEGGLILTTEGGDSLTLEGEQISIAIHEILFHLKFSDHRFQRGQRRTQ